MEYIYTNHNNGVKAQVRISAVAYHPETPASAFAVYGYSPAAEQRTAAIAELMIEHQGVALTALGQLGMSVGVNFGVHSRKCAKQMHFYYI